MFLAETLSIIHMKTFKIISAAALLLCLSACTYDMGRETGTPFREENVSKIVKGKTTEAEVVFLLGQPAGRSSSGNMVTLTYRHGKITSKTNPGIFGFGSSMKQGQQTSVVIVQLVNGVVSDLSTQNESRDY